MAFSVGSSTPQFTGLPFTGGNNYPGLATDQLINTGIKETNVSIFQQSMNINELLTEETIVTYDLSFLAPNNNSCDNYAAVLLVEYAGAERLVDARCYNSTGNGFINTENGDVNCTQMTDDNIPYTVTPPNPRTPGATYQFGGKSDFIKDTLLMDIIDGGYVIEVVTGQIDDGVCDLTDAGALVDNFNFLTLNLNALDPSGAGIQNTFSAAGFTPNGDVTFIYSFNVNTPADVSTRVAPDDICLGLDTPLVNPRRLRTVQADGNGDASFNFNIPASVAGATVHIQAVDITTCLGSNVNEETIDGPTQGQPPVLLALNPETAGQVNTLSATDTTPNSDVMFIYGFNQGSVAANNICPGFQSGIINPKTLPIVQSNGAGAVNLNVNVPANLAGVNVVLQAVDITNCTGSNVNQETL